LHLLSSVILGWGDGHVIHPINPIIEFRRHLHVIPDRIRIMAYLCFSYNSNLMLFCLLFLERFKYYAYLSNPIRRYYYGIGKI
jgi:hypothetical protein